MEKLNRQLGREEHPLEREELLGKAGVLYGGGRGGHEGERVGDEAGERSGAPPCCETPQCSKGRDRTVCGEPCATPLEEVGSG